MAEHCEVIERNEQDVELGNIKYMIDFSLGLVNILDHGRFTRTHSLCMRI